MSFSTTALERNRWKAELVRRIKGLNLEAWGVAIDIAWSTVQSDPDMKIHNEGVRAQFAEKLAEQMMLEQNKCPPTFTSRIDCPLCGPMPCRVGEEQGPCPWDATEIGEVARDFDAYIRKV